MSDIVVHRPHEAAVMPVLEREDVARRYNTLREFASAAMTEGIDFGVIPGTQKKTLLKPGAEKLTTLFGLTPTFEVVERVQDWTGVEHDGEPFFYYWYRCRLYRGDMLVAEGDGSCNSWEKKYRYRTQDRACPECGEATIKRSKPQYGGGWYCFAKIGGCGANFDAGDERITGQQAGLAPNPDIADVVNTILKMAKKRALVDATLLAVNASEFFTQDMEDFIDVPASAAVEMADFATLHTIVTLYQQRYPDTDKHPDDVIDQVLAWACDGDIARSRENAERAIVRMKKQLNGGSS